MNTHIAVLPLEIIESFSAQLDSEGSHGRFLRLPHPRTGLPSLFLHGQTPGPDSRSSIVEVQTVAPDAKRSWFLGQSEVISDGKLILMTPVDPAFLLFPLIQAAFPSDSASNFRTLEDIFELASTALRQANDGPDANKDDTFHISERDLHTFSRLNCVGESMRRICDFKDVTPEITVFRFSKEKYMSYVVKKARRLGESEVLLKCETLVRGLARNDLMNDNMEQLLKAGLYKVACELVSQYISPDIHKDLLTHFDFTALDAHIEDLDKRNLASSVQDNGKGEKKSKAQKVEESTANKRKAVAQGSKGVEKLKKANINGMAKLSSFFQKPATAK